MRAQKHATRTSVRRACYVTLQRRGTPLAMRLPVWIALLHCGDAFRGTGNPPRTRAAVVRYLTRPQDFIAARPEGNNPEGTHARIRPA